MNPAMFPRGSMAGRGLPASEMPWPRGGRRDCRHAARRCQRQFHSRAYYVLAGM